VDVGEPRDRPVREVMTEHVLGIVPDAPLDVALRMMAETHVRHLPVVDHRGCLGLLHETDVLWRLWSTGGADRPRCDTVMRTPVPCVNATDTVRTAARHMARIGTDVTLVLDDGQVVGIVTASNLVRLLASG
jgi:CBS domain-containing protein